MLRASRGHQCVTVAVVGWIADRARWSRCSKMAASMTQPDSVSWLAERLRQQSVPASIRSDPTGASPPPSRVGQGTTSQKETSSTRRKGREVLHRLFIGGEWFPSGTGRIGSDQPTTEEVFASVPDATTADIDRAVAAARTAFDEGPGPVWPDRAAAILTKVSDALKARWTRWRS